MVDLEIPKPRRGSCFPAHLEPRRASEKAITAVFQVACVPGVSPRSVDELVNTSCMTSISRILVLRLCAEIDVLISAGCLVVEAVVGERVSVRKRARNRENSPLSAFERPEKALFPAETRAFSRKIP